jgi:hypothetical protein
LAKRILVRIPRFSLEAISPPVIERCIASNAVIIGVYRGSAEQHDWVAVYETGIAFHEGDWWWLSYSAILGVGVDVVDGKKVEADRVRVQTTDNRTRTVAIVGGDGKFRDVFQFSTFLSRAAALHKEAGRR